jgi:uncharacterized protein YqhQ
MGIGGKASHKGVTFASATMRVRVRENPGGDYARAVSKNRSALAAKLGKIPFLRGLTLFFQPDMGAVLVLLAVNDALTIAGVNAGGGLTDLMLLVGLAVVLAAFWIVRRVKGYSLGAVRRYHAAEHMAINTYEARLPLTAENVAAAKRTHPRCGTSLAVIMLLLGAPVIIFCPYGLALVPAICLAYEIFLALPKARVLKPLYRACLWVQQHITTAAPGEKEIEVAVRGMKRLVEGEKKQ